MPNRFDIFIIERNIGILQIYPIPHTLGQVIPQIFILHHLAAAGLIILLYRNLFADIFLRNPQRLFHPEFHRQPVRIPAALSPDILSLQRLIATKHILNRSCHHMMNPRRTIGRRRSFIKNKSIIALTQL